MNMEFIEKIDFDNKGIKSYEKNINPELFRFEFYTGEKWKKNTHDNLLADFTTKKEFKTFKELFYFWNKEFSENSFSPNINNSKSCLNQVAQYLLHEGNDYTSWIEQYLNNFKNSLNDLNYFLSETTLYELMIKEGLDQKNNYYQNGFLIYFYEHNYYNNISNHDMISGFKHVTELKSNRKNKEAWGEIEKTISKYKKDYILFKRKIQEIEKWRIEEQEKIESKKVELEASTSSAIDGLKEQKAKLMLSGPLKMWHDRLSIYEGGKYFNKKGKDFKFVHISNKRLRKMSKSNIEKEKKRNILDIQGSISKEDINMSKMGQIKRDKWIALLFGIFGMVLTALIISAPIIIFKNYIWDDNHKLIILTSVLGSFGLFIYGYILRILMKNWISSRHIAEEIKERISLTQFYLTLIQDKKIDEANSEFALKEIFKRINNGLIKNTEDKTNILDIISKFK